MALELQEQLLIRNLENNIERKRIIRNRMVNFGNKMRKIKELNYTKKCNEIKWMKRNETMNDVYKGN